jgi:non-specific serine/threonine protein kinase
VSGQDLAVSNNGNFVRVNKQFPLGNLPAEVSSFVGRRRELSEVRRLLSTTRLLTLTGVGGVGKTRLALRAAASLQRSFANGAWLVELAGLPDPSLVPQAVADALGLAIESPRGQHEQLAEFLAGRQLLLVLDNCEHLIPACARLVTELLRAAPRLRILATSRAPLGVPEERGYLVAPLPVAEPGQLTRAGAYMGYPGMVLFAERAAAIRPGFVVNDDNLAQVVQVCQLLDGIPLALELAAARIRALSLAQLADRLDDRFQLLISGNRAALPRHQTLRAAMQWSFELCTSTERLVWMRASVFADRFDLSAARVVCAGEGVPATHVAAALDGLVDKSVLLADAQPDGPRYRLLNTVRGFGLDRLRDACDGEMDETVLRHRHRDHYLALAEEFDADRFGPRQAQWTRQLHEDLPNLRAALAFCTEHPAETRTGLRLAGALLFFWSACGEISEGRWWLERLLTTDPYPSRERVRALVAYNRLLPRADEPGPTDPALAFATCALGLGLMLLRNELAQGPELIAHSRAICMAHGDQWWLGNVLIASILPALWHGELDQAGAFARDALRVSQALDGPQQPATTIQLLAWMAGAAQNHARAARLLGVDGYAAELDAGAALTPDAAITLAVAEEEPAGLRPPRRPNEPPRLTPRERQIAELIAEGLSNQQIASQLVISRRTVESHVENILAKFGFTSRAQVAAWYAEHS